MATDQNELATRLVQETMTSSDSIFALALDTYSALTLIGVLQLSLRHPMMPATAAICIRAVIDGLIAQFDEAGLRAHAEAARLGGDPANDVPV